MANPLLVPSILTGTLKTTGQITAGAKITISQNGRSMEFDPENGIKRDNQPYPQISDIPDLEDALAAGGLGNIASHTVLANVTGSPAIPVATAISAITAYLSILVGDSGSGGTAGLVPAPASGDFSSHKFLSAGGTWVVVGTSSATVNQPVLRDGSGRAQVVDPSAAQDIATKNYVDMTAQGLSVKSSAKVATTTALPSNTYSNGTSGVGATITMNGSGTLTIDGVVLSLGDVVLVKNETGGNQPHNGLYTVTNAGGAGLFVVLTRSVGMDAPTEFFGAFSLVLSGTINASTGWVCTTPTSGLTVGTTNITFVQFSAVPSYTAGSGLTLTGTQFSIGASQVTLSMLANISNSSILGNVSGSSAAPSELTSTQVKTLLAISLSTDVSGTLQAAQFPALTGDATTTSGSLSVTISAGAVGLSKMANLAANSIIGNNTGSPATPAALTPSQVKTLLSISLSSDVSGTLQAAQFPALTGDVTNSAGSLSTTISNGAVTLTKMASIPNNAILSNFSGSSAIPQANSPSSVMVHLPTFIGDSGSGGTQGVVPAPASGDTAAGKFLSASGVFANVVIANVTGLSSALSGLAAIDDATFASNSTTQPPSQASVKEAFRISSLPLWQSNVTYTQYAIINRLGVAYSSNANGNLNHDPSTDTTHANWTPVGGSASSTGTVGTNAVTTKRVVYITSSGTLQHASNDTETTATAIGIAFNGGASAATIVWQASGSIMVGFGSGMTPGTFYYLGTNGQVITDPNTITIGSFRVAIGIAVNATDLLITIGEPVQVITGTTALVGLGRTTLWTGSVGSLPGNLLQLNGAAVGRSFYSQLFSLWGTSYGVGDGSTTFNIPDLSSLSVKDSTGTVISFWTVQAFPDTVLLNNPSVIFTNPSSGLNYISNGTFESDISGWATYNDGASATPVDGTGGTAVLTLARNGTTPLIGTGDGLITKDAANRQGQGISYDFTLDPAVLGSTLGLSFYFKTSTNYAAGDILAYLYDKTNSNFIPISINSLPTASAGTYFSATFWPASTSTSYRLVFHVATTNALAWTMNIDQVTITPFIPVLGAAIGGEYAGQMSFQNVPGTIDLANSHVWRKGDLLEGVIAITLSGAVTGQINVLFPSGLTSTFRPVGYAIGTHSSSRYGGDLSPGLLGGGIGFNLEYRYPFGGNGATAWTATTPITWASTDVITVYFQAKISQWSSNVNLASDFTEYASNDGSGGTTTNTTFTTGQKTGQDGSAFVAVVSTDFSNGFSTKYAVDFAREIQSTDQLILEINDNGIGWGPLYAFMEFAVQGNARYGVQVRRDTTNKKRALVEIGNSGIYPGSTYGTNNGSAWSAFSTVKWRVRKVSNGNMAEQPSMVRAEYISVPSTATNVVLNFQTKVEDTHSAVTTGASWKFVCPVAGLYLVETNSYTTGTAGNCQIFKNGSRWRYFGTTPVTATSGSSNITLRLVVGDQIWLQNDSAASQPSDVNVWIQITRIGS